LKAAGCFTPSRKDFRKGGKKCWMVCVECWMPLAVLTQRIPCGN